MSRRNRRPNSNREVGQKRTEYAFGTIRRKGVQGNAILFTNVVNVVPVNMGRRTVKSVNRILL